MSLRVLWRLAAVLVLALGLFSETTSRVLAGPTQVATPGSGSAAIDPPDTVLAGSFGSWSIDYTAAEDFDRPTGGIVVLAIPVGWTDPVAGPLVVPGHVEAEGPGTSVDSTVVQGREIWVYAGGSPGTPFATGDHLLIKYGSPAPGGRAQVQTAAPATAPFLVASDPQGQLPAPLAAGSPELAVVPATAAVLDWEPATLTLTAGVPAPVRLEARDIYGNLSPVANDQLLSLTSSSLTLRVLAGGTPVSEVVFPADSTGLSLEVLETAAGSGVTLRAADGDGVDPALAAALATVSTGHGPPVALAVRGIQDPLDAGTAVSVVVEVFDAYLNRVTGYSGTVGFDSSDGGGATQLPGDYTFGPGDAGIHVFGGEVVLSTAGEQRVGAEDRASPQISGEQTDITVVPAAAVTLAVEGIADPTIAGSANDLAVEARDAYGNRAAGYRGTVRFATDDPHPGAVVPGDHTFTAGDSGSHAFPGGVVLMSVGVRAVSAADVDAPAIAGAQTGIDVLPGPPSSAVLAPAGAVLVTAGATQGVVLTVRDAAGNPVPGEAATIAIVDVAAADGALASDPAHPGGTQGGPSVQSGTTDAAGRLSVHYIAPLVAGLADTLDAWTASIAPAAVAGAVFTSTAAGATRLVLGPAGALSDTAFAPILLVVEAEDTFGNLDPQASPLVRLTANSPSARFSTDGGSSWSAGPADSLVLAGGTSANRLRVRDPAAGTIAVAAADVAGVLAGDGRDLTVRPAPPAGVIPLAVLPDTLTADGRSEAAVAGGPVADRYGNAVPAMPVTVDAPPGQVMAVDEGAAPGIQRLTDSSGRFSFDVRAAETPGAAQVSAVSGPAPDQGTAAGTAALTFAPRVTLALEPNTLVPAGAVPGDTVAFTIAVRNLGPSAATFGGGSVLRFAEPGGATYASALAVPVVVPAGGVATLGFAAERLDPAFAPGRYTPLLTLAGADARGAAIDTLVAAELGAFGLELLAIEQLTAPARVARGQLGAQVLVTLTNLGENSVPVTGVGLDFSEPAYVERGVVPPLPDLLPGRSQRTYTVTVDVDPLATVGPVAIDGRADFQVGGSTHVIAGAQSPAAWTVDTAASLSYLDESLGPRIVSAGQTHLAGVVLDNTGGADVILDPGLTRLIFGPAGAEFETPLAAPTLVPGNRPTALRFADVGVPGGYPPGQVAARLQLGGSEHGSPYAGALVLGDSLRVFAPAALAVVSGTMAPDSVSLGQVRSFSLEIANTGGAEITLRTGTVLRLTGAIAVDLELAGAPLAIPAGVSAALSFGPGAVDPALGPGPLAAAVMALTEESGIEGALPLAVPEPLVAEPPAVLRWVAGSLVPARVTRGEPAAFTVDLANDGGARVEVLAGTVLTVSDGVDRLDVIYPGPPVAVSGGSTASLAFPAAVVLADLAAQPYAPALAVTAREHGLTGAAAVAAPPAELLVEAPADLRYLTGSLNPDLVVVGDQVAFRVLVENRGGASARPGAATGLSFTGFSVLLDMLRSPAEIPGGTADTLFFQAATLTTVDDGSHSLVVGFRGQDWNGTPLAVDLDLAPDTVTVLDGAALEISEFASAALRGPRVNRSQSFPLRLRIVNRGGEAVAGATATAGGPGLAAPVAVPLGTIAVGDTAVVEMMAAAASAAGTAAVQAGVQGGAGAVSGNPPAVLPAADDTLSLVIEREARLQPAIAIRAPAGAVDGVISGGSLVDLEVTVTNTGDAPVGPDGTVELRVPAGYGILGPARQTFAAGTPVAFAVAAPPGAAAPDSLVGLLIDIPLDLNSGAQAQVITPRAATAIRAVEAARLRLDASIVEPVDAQDGTALPDQTVTIEGQVTNLGTAAAPGAGVLALTLAPELALAPGEPSQRPFTVGQAVRFQIVAADRPGPPHALSLTITAAPADENTGQPAAVERPEATLGLATIARGIEVTGGALATAPPALLRGGPLQPVLVLTVANPGPPSPEHTIVLTGLTPALLQLAEGGSGGGSTAADPAAVLGGLELRRDFADGVVAAVWTGAGLPSLALADTLAGQESRTYVLALGARAGAPAGSYRAVLGSPGTVVARDPGTGDQVSVLLAAGTVESAPFTLYEGPHAVPNPFGPGREAARLTYVLERDAAIEIQIFTLFGDRVWSRSLAPGENGGRAGLNQVAWDGRNDSGESVRNGVYHCRIRGGDIDAMVKVAAIR